MRKLTCLLACLLALLMLPLPACAQQEYRLRDGLITVLLAGTDRRSAQESDPLDFRNGGQADFLLLLVVDGENQTITPIHIDRDAMTQITTLSVLGKVSGTRRAQICLAHSFGDGKETSAQLLCEAVSRLMGDVPIDYYCTLSMYAVPELNDAIGGVEVTLGENDDFSAYDAAMTPGQTLRLMGRQAYLYTTRRYYVGDGSNEARQARQRTYIYAAIDQLLAQISQEGPQVIMDLVSLMNQYVTTNLNWEDLALLGMTIAGGEIAPIRTLEGTHQIGRGGFMEFIPDEAALAQLIQDVFYEPVQ